MEGRRPGPVLPGQVLPERTVGQSCTCTGSSGPGPIPNFLLNFAGAFCLVPALVPQTPLERISRFSVTLAGTTVGRKMDGRIPIFLLRLQHRIAARRLGTLSLSGSRHFCARLLDSAQLLRRGRARGRRILACADTLLATISFFAVRGLPFGFLKLLGGGCNRQPRYDQH